MWKIRSTGKNLNYGKKGEWKLISNEHHKFGRNSNYWDRSKYAGSGRLVITVIKK